MNDIILKTDGRNRQTRILRPHEVRSLINAIPKNEYKDKFEALLYTGARYTEMQQLYEHPPWFMGNSIKMKSSKPKAKHKERYIRLNSQGQRVITYFLRAKKNLPHYVVWGENLKRWAEEAGLDSTGISIKSTRKTWESWLVSTYPKQLEYIFLSQGHTMMTALQYYLMIPFTKEDIEEMKFYTEGWI